MAWTPAEIVESRKFLLPVWKPDFSGLIEVGDFVRLLAKSDDGIDKAVDLQVFGVSADGRTISWERTAAGSDPDGPFFSSDITAVHSQHIMVCPEVTSLCFNDWNYVIAPAEVMAAGDQIIASFETNLIVAGTVVQTIVVGPWDPAIAGDDILLEDALNIALAGRGHAVVSILPGIPLTDDTDVFLVFITGIALAVDENISLHFTNSDEDVELVNCDEEAPEP